MTGDDRLDKIFARWHEDQLAGKDIDPSEVIRDYPDIAESLRARFQAVELIDRAFNELRQDAGGTPRRLGEYEVLREIGRGGMGVVYEAYQTSMARNVALKVLSPAITSTKRAVKRFQREARAAGRLQHTNIVPVHTIGEEQGLWFYSMELIRGRALHHVIDDIRKLGERPGEQHLALVSTTKSLSVKKGSEEGTSGTAVEDIYFVRIAQMFAGVADALETAHEQGVIHRDVKPSNLILDTDGILKVTDFGLARVEGEGLSLTGSGAIVGTPAYMSPEQAGASRAPIDHRTDIYSLGATLYEVLTLRPPFTGETPQQICSQVVDKDPVLPRRVNGRIPKDLETIVSKAMEKEPGKRYSTGREMAEDLGFFAVGAPVRARPTGPVGRAWRKVKRHKARAALVSAVVLLASAAGVLGLSASRESALRRDLQYGLLCSRADSLLTQTGRLDSDHDVHAPSREEALGIFGNAIALAPDRPEAYFGRSLAKGRGDEAKLEDIDAAAARGLPERTALLARALILRGMKRWDEAAEARRRAEQLPGGRPEDAYFEGLLHVRRGDRQEGIRLLTKAIDRYAEESYTRFHSLHARAFAREAEGDLGGALEDLAAFRAVAGESLATAMHIASLWYRLGEENRAQAAFHEALDKARSAATENAWGELCRACSGKVPHIWHDNVTEEAVRLYPESPHILWNRALALDRAGETSEAIALMERRLQLEPDSHGGHERYALELMDQDRHEDALIAFRRALELNPLCGHAHARMADTLARLGRREEALEHLEQANRLEGGSRHVQEGRALALERLGLIEEALDVRDRVIQLEPKRAASHLKRAVTLIKLERYEDALKAADQAVQIDPEYEVAFIAKGDALTRLARWDDALAAYREAAKDDPENSDVGYHMAGLGDRLNQRGQLEEALPILEEAARLAPRDASILVSIGAVLNNLRRFEEGLATLDRAVAMDAQYANTHTFRGVALSNLGKPKEAFEAYERAIEIDPDNVQAQLNRASILTDFERYEEAIEALRPLMRKSPNLPNVPLELGIALFELERYAEALDAYDRAIELGPEWLTAHLARGEACRRLKRYDLALASYEMAVEIDPDSFDAQYGLGSTLYRLRQRERAVEALEEAIRLDPEHVGAHFKRGYALNALKHYDEAYASFERALELDPDHYNARYNRAYSLLFMDRYEDAVKAFEDVLKRKPEDKWALYHYGAALRHLHRFEDALAAYDQALKVDPKDAWLHFQRGKVLRRLYRYEEAIASFRRGAELKPNDPAIQLGELYAWLDWGKYEEGLQASDKGMQRVPDCLDFPMMKVLFLRASGHLEDARRAAGEFLDRKPDDHHLVAYAYLCAVAGKKDEAERFVQKGHSPSDGECRYERARIYAVLGDREKAIHWLQKAVESGHQRPAKAAPDPDFRALRDDSRYQAILEKMLVE